MIIRKKAFTLVEMLIAMGILSLFVVGVFSLFSQGQKTIAKGTWINNATNQEALMLRKITELTQKSSYPSTVQKKVMKVNDNNNYKGHYKNLPNEVVPTGGDILAFPMCKAHTEDDKGVAIKGEIEWAYLSLVMNPKHAGYANLTLSTVAKVSYPANLNSTVIGMSQGKYNKNATKKGNLVLLNDIEKVKIAKMTTSTGSCVNFNFILSNPKDNKFKKKVQMALMLNVDCIAGF